MMLRQKIEPSLKFKNNERYLNFFGEDEEIEQTVKEISQRKKKKKKMKNKRKF
jgi:predicted membrane GTPase involved in stress response